MIIFDAHCDTLDRLTANNTMYNSETHYNFNKASLYDTHIQVCDIWVNSEEHDVHDRVETLIKRFKSETQKVNVIKSANELKSATGICTILGIEGGEGIDGSIERLRELYDRGVRLLTLTWNHENKISGTAFEKGAGLTDFGKKTVLEMERLGMMVDVSHLSDAGFYDVANIAQKPFIASHSNSREICDIFRNLTDDMFKVLTKCGGVTGINLCPDFLGVKPGIDTIIEHIEHFMALDGENSVGIGADFDGIDDLPRDINGTEDLDKIINRLLTLNYSQELVDKIAYKNMLRVFSEIL